jgi:preprotein translocase subunit SecD
MKRSTSILWLAGMVAGIIVFSLLGIYGLPVGRYDVLPLSQSVSQGLDLRGGVYAVYEAKDPKQSNLVDKMNGAILIMRNRLDSQGFTEATISHQGDTRIRVEIPGVSDPDQVFTLIGKPAKLEFFGPDGTLVMTGDRIVKASAGTQGGQIVVNFTLNAQGTKEFSDATAKYLNQRIAIKLDGVEISSPNVNSVIPGGSGYIEGSFTQGEAQQLALQLQSGALPVELNQLEARTISATLGVDALKTSVEAGLIGLIVVILFMLINYRLPGALASIALLIYTLIVLFIICLTGIQLTLPGIAGIILGIGMAVDANVIIFERIKDEMMAGKTLRSGVDAGFKKAFSAVFDSNLTTILAGAVLVVLGTGPIKGFAYTLILGVTASMFTAITVTRFLLNIMIRLNVTHPWLYNHKWHKEEVAKV